MLLLDEPSSGSTTTRTRRFGELLQRVVAERGIGVLLVEHDMELVVRICEYVYVLDFGTMIFAGTPTEIASSEMVRAAYLGSDEVMEAVDLVEAGGAAVSASERQRLRNGRQRLRSTICPSAAAQIVLRGSPSPSPPAPWWPCSAPTAPARRRSERSRA